MTIKLAQRTYLNTNKSAAVGEDHPDAAFLLGGKGAVIPEDQAQRYGIDKAGSLPSLQAAEDKPSVRTKRPS